MPTELHLKHRPRKFDAVYGQDAVVALLKEKVAKKIVPHATIFIGPSGTGKTTMARILARAVGCNTKEGSLDFEEVNCALIEDPLDKIRSIDRLKTKAPIRDGGSLVWILDEVQSLSRATFCQQAMLKMLEDTPAHVYFMLAATDPSKILPTILNRCMAIEVKPLPHFTIKKMLADVASKENIHLYDETAEKIAGMVDGSAREALVLLERVADLKTMQEQVDNLVPAAIEKEGIDIARALIGRVKWSEMTKLIMAVQEEPEKVRHTILTFAYKVALGGGKQAAYAIWVINAFRDDFTKCGKAGLVAACYEVTTQKD